MCIYCGTTKYRKIYENHYGPIPKDNLGKSYHIHHIDGNRFNNDLTNLIAVSVQEHYDIHYSQNDFGACNMLGKILNIDEKTLSELNRNHNLARVNNGTHHLLSGKIQSKSSKKRAEEGTLGFQNKENLAKANLIRDSVISEKIKQGTWILQDKDFHMKNVAKQLENGKHCSQIKKTCEYCGKTLDSANYNRSHGLSCVQYTGKKKTISKHPPRERKTCEKCNKTMDISNFHRHGHGHNCKRVTK